MRPAWKANLQYWIPGYVNAARKGKLAGNGTHVQVPADSLTDASGAGLDQVGPKT
jgi:hypothetical protein